MILGHRTENTGQRKKMTKTRVRTRIAPSPTGFAHVGTAYHALLNYAFARKNNGEFILRLEDSDIKRNIPEAEESIYAGLSWLGLSWDEGPDKGGPFVPYRLSERLELYKEKAGELIKKGLAYEDQGAIRFKNPGADIEWKDLIRGHIKFPGQEVTDFVIMKSDGYPTYNFAVAIDDLEMEITHVIRGEEHISNTPRQIAIYKAFEKSTPFFAHHPTLRNMERKKLSKRRDPVDLRMYREEGYLAEALVNFLCLLGWSHPEEKEIFTLPEFVEKFDISRVRKAGPVFDTKKLDWLNGMYIRQKSDEDLTRLVRERIPTVANVDQEFLMKVAPLVKDRISKLSEIEPLISFFWDTPQIAKEVFDDPARSALHITAALNALRKVDQWNLSGINKALQKEVEDNGFKTGDFYMTLRKAFTGKAVTPPINDSMAILGRDQVLHRLEEVQKVLIDIELPEIS